ncbi:MAG: IS256 family transposase [Pseudomonadota bacterium]
MNNDSTPIIEFPGGGTKDILTRILREGARTLLAQAVEAEVEEWIEARSGITDETGRKQVVRNGHMPERSVLTGLGEIPVRKPRVRDRRENDERERFQSKILPPYLRKAKSVEELIPWLYLRGISTGDFTDALAAILGDGAPGLSASTVVRLKASWEAEHIEWEKRSLTDKNYAYIWADGVYFNIRLEDDRQCILVLIGATENGRKELIAIADGFRESEQSWSAMLLDLKSRGLKFHPKLAIGDGALGFWAALRKVFPSTREQRCWVHKTGNVLNYLPGKHQAQAKRMIHDIWMASSRADAERAFDLFVETWGAKYPKAVHCLQKDREALLTFYDFPAEHWSHIRTTNPIESTFATVRLRTRRTKGSGSRAACLAMVFKLVMLASESWRALNGSNLLPQVISGVQFKDGIMPIEAAA